MCLVIPNGCGESLSYFKAFLIDSQLIFNMLLTEIRDYAVHIKKDLMLKKK